MKNIKKVIGFVITSFILLPNVHAQSISERYTLLCPFLNDNYRETIINGEAYFEINDSYLDKRTITKNDEMKTYIYNLPIPNDVAELLDGDIYQQISYGKNTLDGFQVIGIRTHAIEFDPVIFRALKIKKSDCDISLQSDTLLENRIASQACELGQENQTFDNVFIKEMVKANGKGYNPNKSSADKLSGFANDSVIYNQKNTLTLLEAAVHEFVNIASPTGKKRFCEDRTYTNFKGQSIQTFCEPTTIQISQDAIADNVPEYSGLNTACSVKVPFKIRVGESIFLNNLESAINEDKQVGLTIGYATVKCEYVGNSNTPEFVSVPNTGNCDPNNIELYQNGTLETSCDRQLCLFTGRAACPPEVFTWGVDTEGNQCRASLPFAMNGTTFQSLQNENPTKDGAISVMCLAQATEAPSWQIITEASGGFTPVNYCNNLD